MPKLPALLVVLLAGCTQPGTATTSDGDPDSVAAAAAGPPVEVSAELYAPLAAEQRLRAGDVMLAVAIRQQIQDAPPITQDRFQQALAALTAVNDAEAVNHIGVQTTLVFSSVADLEVFLPQVPRSAGVDWIGYDMEGGMTPDAELGNPVAAVQRFAADVSASGRRMSWGPISDRFGALDAQGLLDDALAPPVAGATLQGQKILSMGGLDALRSSVVTTKNQVLRASPTVRFALQLFLPTDTVAQAVAGFNAAFADLGSQLGLAVIGTTDLASADAVLGQLSWRRR